MHAILNSPGHAVISCTAVTPVAALSQHTLPGAVSMQLAMERNRTCPSTFGSGWSPSRPTMHCQHRRFLNPAAAVKRCNEEHHMAARPDALALNNQGQLLERVRNGGIAALLCAVMVLSPMDQPLAAQASQKHQPKVREELEGPARIVDGDTLWIDNTKIRLFGVDAPETKQSCADALGKGYTCGQEAMVALQQHMGGAPVHCVVRNKDQYGRSVATCGIERGAGAEEDIGAWMVANGHAVAYRQYSKNYVALEQQAHEQGLGVWQGGFMMPSEWRKAQRGHRQVS